MVTRKDVENCGQTVEDLALLARKLGYRSRFGQLVFNNGATASDLFDFFEDNPGAIEAVLTWVLDHGCTRDGDPIEDDERGACGDPLCNTPDCPYEVCDDCGESHLCRCDLNEAANG
jgi:hypothetical protein